MRQVYALLLSPVLANAGVVYEIAVRPVDQSNMAPVSQSAPSAASISTQYSVEKGMVRIGAAGAKAVYLFKEGTMYVIDNPSRTVHALRHAKLAQVAAHYADAVKQLEDAAAGAPPGGRAEAERKVADIKAVSDRLRQPASREYRVTSRFESVDGRACRIWEERESDAKRLELCIAPTASIPGGTEILGGMKILSQFREGGDFALGVEFGLSEWWPEVETLGGVPILVREYKYDSQISEVTLTAVRQGAVGGATFELPDGYPVQDGPDYARWYVR